MNELEKLIESLKSGEPFAFNQCDIINAFEALLAERDALREVLREKLYTSRERLAKAIGGWSAYGGDVEAKLAVTAERDRQREAQLKAERDALREWKVWQAATNKLAAVTAERDALREFASFAKSCILSNEQWTPTAQAMYDNAVNGGKSTPAIEATNGGERS